MLRIVPVEMHQQNILQNLIQFYIYEFSQYLSSITLEDNGLYKPFDLDKYWTEDQYHAFFVKLGDEFIGFALVESETDTSPNAMEEFFIIKKYKGKGYGKMAAVELFNRFPGNWFVTQVKKNYPAQAFWRSVISEYTNNKYTERYDENRMSIQEFKSGT
ncbi:GNAT family N-acetyltransferase [Bacillus sp. S/N-304-OC-R1]|uniref:GNAT family N-acetyltransferase n=1 Tax=Bacillus sp. S/N-304-OC-R1 TaxID=2758034 RepID=UPI001C8F10B1|nr:GNAT family N-acetyltransferase [Bacillus sp. S/N-304-OC-R1]MBY0121128.1 GNAT family N-acetyltransferase [Bacillus sp. S/N-304-OC-R1]